MRFRFGHQLVVEYLCSRWSVIGIVRKKSQYELALKNVLSSLLCTFASNLARYFCHKVLVDLFSRLIFHIVLAQLLQYFHALHVRGEWLEKFGENHAQCVDVHFISVGDTTTFLLRCDLCFRTVGLLAHLFRAHVQSRANNARCCGVCTVIVVALIVVNATINAYRRQTKVAHFDGAVAREENVRGLQRMQFASFQLCFAQPSSLCV